MSQQSTELMIKQQCKCHDVTPVYRVELGARLTCSHRNSKSMNFIEGKKFINLRREEIKIACQAKLELNLKGHVLQAVSNRSLQEVSEMKTLTVKASESVSLNNIPFSNHRVLLSTSPS
ncbi:hypothetical protein RRG08_052551 [Elysia crispata]|uniref:Uncharacterized protein n=1 Tax=Elysia crispata TaxID=231223 RepID=A0AAE1DAD6_9GAST|nr:hypothetical protein RRG08_052551 [Elysia crispata]